MATTSEKALRKALIRLAQKRPDIRDTILPILKEAGLIPVGTTIEFPRSGTRVHRSKSDVQVWDLTWAGKRGKAVLTFTIYDLDYLTRPMIKQVEDWVSSLDRMDSFQAILKSAQDLNERTPGDKLDLKVIKAVEVAPLGFGPIEIRGDKALIKSGWNDFTVKNLVDKYNEPTCMPAIKGGKRSIKKFYRWVKDNEGSLKSMSFSEILSQMRANDIKYHVYCAID